MNYIKTKKSCLWLFLFLLIACGIVPAATITSEKFKGTSAVFTTMSSGTAKIGTLQLSKVNNVYFSASYASIEAALTAIGSTPAILVVNSSINSTGNPTFPTTLDIVFTKGGIINYTTTTLTFTNQPVAGIKQRIFNGTGIVLGLTKAYPDWWLENTIPGTTDMTTAVQAACYATVMEGYGIYGVSSPIVAASLNHTKISGVMTLKAISAIDAVLFVAGDVEVDAGVTIDGGLLATYGLIVGSGSDAVIHPKKITNVKEFGISIGYSSYTATRCNVFDTVVEYHNSATPVLNGFSNYKNLATSVGVYVYKGPDARVSNVTVAGFRTGFKETSDSPRVGYFNNKVSSSPVWGPTAYGFDSSGADTTFVQNYVYNPHNWYSYSGDTSYAQATATVPEVFGFYIRTANPAMVNNTVYLSNSSYDGTDGLVNALYFSTPSSGYVLGTVLGGAGTSYKYKTIFGGTIDNLTMIGNKLVDPSYTSDDLSTYPAIGNVPTFANNSSALAGGLSPGQLYRTSTGLVGITFTP